MSSEFTIITDSVVNVLVTSSVNTFGSERRFQKNVSIGELKNKFELLTGGSAATMQLELYTKDDRLITTFDNNSALLGSYPIDNGMRIHVVDKSLAAGEFEDVSKVQKFEISEEDYSKRADSVRAFKMKNKLGEFNAEEEALKNQKQKLQEETEKVLAEAIHLEDRCLVKVPNQPTKRGIVMFVGNTHFHPGIWIGVKYDEPLGKNDGSVNGQRYFNCEPKYGAFVKPQHVTIGEFPEEDFGLDLDEM